MNSKSGGRLGFEFKIRRTPCFSIQKSADAMPFNSKIGGRPVIRVRSWTIPPRLPVSSPNLSLAMFRSGDDFGDRFSSMGRIFSWRSLPTFGWLYIIRCSEGTHGHGKAPGEAPTRENAKTGRSPDVGLLDSGKWILSWIGFCSWEGLKRGLQP